MPAPLGTDGLLYYVRFQSAGEKGETIWPESGCHSTIDEAILEAEGRLPSPVVLTQAEPEYY